MTVAAPAAQRRSLIVLGMHRSGTSALTRVLSLCGAALPRHLVPGVAGNNPLGHWEPNRIVAIHDRFLVDNGSSWDDILSLPAGIFDTPGAASCADRLAKAVRSEFGDAPLFILKDPRISRLVPLWRAVLQDVGATPLAIIAVRNPLEVAESLYRRDGWDEYLALTVWMRYMLSAERDTRGMARCFVSYDRLLDDWRSVVNDVFIRLDDASPTLAEADIEAFLRRDLRHHRRSAAELLNRGDIAECIKRTYRAFCHAVDSGEAETGELDAVSEDLARAEALFTRIRTSALPPPVQAIVPETGSPGRNDALLALVLAELGQLRLAARRSDRQLEMLLMSRSWRLTEPYRRGGDWIRRLAAAFRPGGRRAATPQAR